MFTGIVQGIAQVAEIREPLADAKLKTLVIQFPADALEGITQGASIAINGVCLTVTQFDMAHHQAAFDVMAETLALTNLGQLAAHQKVNFERAATLGKEIGGHLMSGHVQGCVTLLRREQRPGNVSLHFSTPASFKKYLLPKGFVGLNGCSLTLGSQINEQFSVHLIPETLRMTTFGELSEGAQVNLEVDPATQAIVDTVERYLASRADDQNTPAV